MYIYVNIIHILKQSIFIYLKHILKQNIFKGLDIIKKLLLVFFVEDGIVVLKNKCLPYKYSDWMSIQ